MMMSNHSALGTMNLPTTSSVDTEDLSILVQELRELGFDAIRFSSYRTAAKLRYIQKKSNFLLVDLWNVIEGFRENGLNGLDPYSIITVPKLESVVTSLFHNLNKRLPLSQQVDVMSCARYLLSWLLIAYDSEGSGRVRMFSVKVGLVTLCNGKLVDKFRYVFSLISDTNSCLVVSRFSEYLQEVLALPSMVLESPTFGFTEGLATTIFDGTSKITVNGFLDALLNEPGPPSLMWLPLLHSMASVEDVSHQVQCSVCKIGNIQGFRYKCQKCSNYNMCQNCFWEGKTRESDNHRTDHEVKEYATCKSGGKGLRNSFRKSLRCVPDKPKKLIVPRFPEEQPLNLSHIVPPSPMPVHNGFSGYDSLADAYNDQKMFALELGHGPSRMTNSYSESVSESDEEHRLIARYTARLASDGKYPPAPQYHSMQHNRTMSQTSMSLFDSTQSQRDMIAQLEARNRDIMNQIESLRAQQELDYLNGETVNPIVMDELHALRDHKMDLEDKLNGLQDSRRHLMGQLEGLMKLLKAQQLSDTESSPRSGKTPSMPIYSQTGSLHRSAPVTPHHSDNYGELRSSFGNSSLDYYSHSYTDNSNSSKNSVSDMMSRSLRDDLLMAADSVTNAMSTLVDELNAEEEIEFEGSENYSQSNRWKRELEAKLQEEEDTTQILMELRNRKLVQSNGSAYATPNGVMGNGGGRIGLPIQFPNGKNNGNGNGNYYERENGHGQGNKTEQQYSERRMSDSLGRRRQSFGNDEVVYSKPHRGNASQSHVNKGEEDLNGTDWEDGLQRHRLMNQ